MPAIKKGTTSVSRYVMIVDSTTGAPETGVDVTTLDLQYTRAGASPVAKVDAASLGAINAAWDDNEMFEVDGTSSPGLYRVDWPNAAFVSGVDSVLLVVTGAGFAPAVEEITLVDNVVGDVVDGSGRVDVGTWIGTAVTLGSGAPDVNIQSTDDIDLSATQKASVNTEADNAIETYNLDHLVAVADSDDVVNDSIIAKLAVKGGSGDWSDFDNTTDSLQAIRDRGDAAWLTATQPEMLQTTTIATLATQISFTLTAGSADDDAYNGCIIVIEDASTPTQKAVGVISDYTGSTKTVTLLNDPGVFTMAPTDKVDILADRSLKPATDNRTVVIDTDGAVSVPQRIFSGTSTGSSTTTKVYVQAGDPPSGGNDDDYNDTIIVVWDGSNKSTARANIRVVDDYDDSDPSFAVSPALGFTPDAGDLVEVYVADAGALTLLNMLASGFAGTSPNRLIDHLRSIMSKGAVTPSSVGTYDPATDSLEYQAEQLALIEGAGFDTNTDSLKGIRDAIDTLVAPAVVGASSLSGSGFLADVVSLIRKATDEPGNSPKYADGDLVELIQVAMDTVMTDVHVNTDHPIIIRYNITLVDGTQDYILPPNVAELLRVAKINSNTGLPEYEVWPGSYMSPGGSGWKLEGNVLRLLRDWDSTETLELMYMPNSEPLIHKGTAEAVTSTTVTLMATPTDGTLGKRPNEYVGMGVRVLSSTENIHEERLITAYDVATRIATINKAWDTTPTGTLVYEVVPIYSRMIKHLIALRASIDLLSQEGNSQRMSTLSTNYAIKMSAMRRQVSKMEGRFPHHFDGDTWDNPNRSGLYGV